MESLSVVRIRCRQNSAQPKASVGEKRKRLRASLSFLSSRAHTNNRLPRASFLGRVERGDGIIESRDVADVRPQPSVAHPLDDLAELGTIGFDDEVDRRAFGRPASFVTVNVK